MSTITRRDFLQIIERILGALGVTAIAIPVVAYFYPTHLEEMPSEPVVVCPLSDLPENTAKTIRFGRYPALVINTLQGLRGYSAVCTHFGCLVKWNAEKNQIECPCHNGYFSAQDGSVLAGPPPEPLMKLTVTVIDNQVYVGGAE
jgi:cytochrome b6-f complex iron-sulfur subunit